MARPLIADRCAEREVATDDDDVTLDAARQIGAPAEARGGST
jgi:hypothetical protein